MRFKRYKFEGVIWALFIAVVFAVCPRALGAHQCDFNSDGIVNLSDFTQLARRWSDSLPWTNDSSPHMLSHWRLDSDATDGQSSYDGVVYGDPVWVTKLLAKVDSGAVYMDGQDYIDIEADSYPELTTSFTIDAWINIDSGDQEQILISKGQSSWQIGVESQTRKAFVSCSGLSDTSYLAGSTSLIDGTWYHLAAVYDPNVSKLYIYLDGELDAQADASGAINQSDNYIRIGGDPERTNDFWWKGYIDDVRIYNYALSSDEIFNSKTIHVDIATGDDNNTGRGRQSAFRTIGKGVESADNGDTVHVWPGTYYESIDFAGKAITVRSAYYPAVISSPDDYAVTFYSGEQADSVLQNFIIKGSDVAISVSSSSPTLKYLTIVNNDYAIDLWGASSPRIESCILWDNIYDDIFTEAFDPNVTYSCIERFVVEEGNIKGNISVDPLFADPNNSDYHLQSKIGRYAPEQGSDSWPEPGTWVIDQVDSPCIDAGKPRTNPMRELMPNGSRVNIGAYGKTAYASKSLWPFESDINCDGKVQNADLQLFIDNWLFITEP